MPFSPKLSQEVQVLLNSWQGLALRSQSQPRLGWVRTLRQALAMSARQLAERMGTQPSRIFEIEKDEVRGAVTLKTLRHVAEALGCDLVYAFVPKERKSLEDLLQQQAEHIVAEQLKAVGHSMALENQEVSYDLQERQRENRVKTLMENPPRWFWD
jgi:predicted DNA-binding mobile mystery protein A